jgi:N-acetylglutamate synthase-like GNAT family acetyltransferase
LYLIERDGAAIGRLYLDYCRDEIRIINIALLPNYRNQGVGSGFLKAILVTATEKKVAVRIHVEQFNRALVLHQRLGFHQIEDQGVYHLMEWQPDKGL